MTCPCGKKWSLDSEALAENLATLLSWLYDDDVARYVYQCDQSGYWHVTRSEPRDDAT